MAHKVKGQTLEDIKPKTTEKMATFTEEATKDSAFLHPAICRILIYFFNSKDATITTSK